MHHPAKQWLVATAPHTQYPPLPDPAEACKPLSGLAARRAGQMAGAAGGGVTYVAVWAVGGVVSPAGLAVKGNSTP